MGKFEKIKKVWNIIKSEWKTHYRLVFSNEQTHEQQWVIKQLTIKKMFVIGVLAAFVIIILTILLIAVTPLKMYIPGYTSKNDYKLYKRAVEHIDSLEQVIQYNQQYIDNFTTMLEGKTPTAEEMDDDATKTPSTHTATRDKHRMKATEELLEESDLILARNEENNNNSNGSGMPNIEQAKITSLNLYPPTIGPVVKLFDAVKGHFGIDIAYNDNSTVISVADGIVLSTYYNSTDGYVIMVQHPGNLISIYKHNASLLKQTGARVSAGTPIATMGTTTSKGGKNKHLHFELWYNGFPVNPLEYLVVE
ncbi:MAG: M23 family metallopeptidase [Bacteroidales bacterium]|nr:M23 family metallopeptidase [Bacteroidales bacterium]